MRADRYRELDGIRAIAIWMVLLGHLFFGGSVHGAIARMLPSAIALVGQHLGRGVDLFFVLSGFLITRMLLDAKAHDRYFSTFYARRAYRILPVYLVVLAIGVVAYGPSYREFYVLSLAFSANFAQTLHVAGPAGMGPLWSLAVEEQFYLVWPLVVALASRRTLAVIAVALVIVEPALRYASSLRMGSVELPVTSWCRSDGLALGALVALWVTSRHANRKTSCFLALALIFACLGSVVLGRPFGAMSSASSIGVALRLTQCNLLFAAFILWAIARSGSRWTSMLRSRWARVSADLSFCLYLVHVPLIDAFTALSRSVVPAFAAGETLAFTLIQGTFVLSGAFAIAGLSRRYLELPFLRMGRRQARLQRRTT
ncbi:MAG: acyltransferase [Vulcanimicrobiaceae bacterium]